MEPVPVPFDRLYAHREWVRRVARALVLDESRAEDLQQQVWLAALEHPPREARSLRGWLGTVLRNTASKMRRSEERTGRREAAAPGPLPDPGPDAIVAETEAHERVVRAVLALEEPNRTTVLLRYFEDLPPSEVAARLSVPVETVRTRLRRALEQVRARLDGEHGGDRRAWCLLLLPLARRARVVPALPAAAGAAAAAGIGGVLMANLAKVAAASTVLGIAGLAVWTRPWEAAEPPSTPSDPGGGGRAAPAGSTASSVAAPAAPAPGAAVREEAAQATAAVAVVEAGGRPVSGAAVALFAPPSDRAGSTGGWPFSAFSRPEAPSLLVRAVTDASGRASLAAPRPGLWRIRIDAAGFASASRGAWLTPGPAFPVPVVLRPASALRGTVRDAAGRPVPGAVVTADRSRSGLSSGPVDSPPTGDGGEYRLEGLGAGMHELAVRTSAGILHTVGSVRVPGVPVLDLRIGGGVAVKGRVVDDATGLPIESASVAVEIGTGGRPFSGMGIATTGAGGEFAVRDLPPGDFGIRIIVFREGYRRFPPIEEREPVFRGLVASGTSWEREIRLKAGTDPSPFPVAEDPRPEGGPGSVEGIVVDPSGAPAPGVRVTVWTASNPFGYGPERLTDAAGRFRVEGIPAGRGSLYARPCAGGTGASLPFTLAGGQAIGELRIEMKPGGTISGAVRRADGAPVEGPLLWTSRGVFAGPVRDHPEHFMRDDALASVRPDGTFHLADLQAGTWLLAAEAEGCAPATAPLLELAEGQEIAGVEIALEPLLVLAGRVADESGRPVPGARVWMETSRREGRGVCAVADAEGRFRVQGLRAGSLKLAAEADGFRGTEAEAAAGDEDVRLTLESAFALAGRVVEHGTGRPLGGVPVHARPENPTDGRKAPRGRWETATGADGSFRIEGILDGAWTVIAGTGGRNESTDFFPETVRGVKAGAEGIEFALRRGTQIRGRFVDEKGGPFAIPLRVQAYRRKPDRELQAVGGEAAPGEDGSFVLGGLEPGPYDLWVRAGQGRGDDTPPTMLVKGVETGAEPITVKVPRGVRIRGRIANLPGPISKGRGGVLFIHGSGEGWWPAMNAWPAEDGTFETEPLDPSWTYDLRARDFPGRLGMLRGVRPGDGEVVLELSEGLRISGRVVDEDGESVGGGVPVLAWATATGPDSPGARSTTTTAVDGTFTLSALADLRYGLQAGGKGSDFLWGHAGETPETSFAPGDEGVVIRVRRGVAMEGRLLDATGRPSAGTRVEALSGSCPTAETGADGSFVLRGLEPGEVKLRVEDRVLGPYPAPATGLEVRLPDR